MASAVQSKISPGLEEGELTMTESAEVITRRGADREVATASVRQTKASTDEPHYFSTPSYCHTPTPPEEGIVQPLDLAAVAARLKQVATRGQRGGKRPQRDIQRGRNPSKARRNRPMPDRRRKHPPPPPGRGGAHPRSGLLSELPHHLFRGDTYRPSENWAVATPSKAIPHSKDSSTAHHRSSLPQVPSSSDPRWQRNPRFESKRTRQDDLPERDNGEGSRRSCPSHRHEEDHRQDTRSRRGDNVTRPAVDSRSHRLDDGEEDDRRRVRLRRRTEDKRSEHSKRSDGSSHPTDHRGSRPRAETGDDAPASRSHHHARGERSRIAPMSGPHLTSFGFPPTERKSTERYRTPPNASDWREVATSAGTSATPSLTSGTSASSFVSISPSAWDLPWMGTSSLGDEKSAPSLASSSGDDTLAALRKAALASKKSIGKNIAPAACESPLQLHHKPPLVCQPTARVGPVTSPGRLAPVGQFATPPQLSRDMRVCQSFPSAPPGMPPFATPWQPLPPPWQQQHQQQGPWSAPPGNLHRFLPNIHPAPWPHVPPPPPLLAPMVSPPPISSSAPSCQTMFPTPKFDYSPWSPTPQGSSTGHFEESFQNGRSPASPSKQLTSGPLFSPPRQPQLSGRGSLFGSSLVIEEMSCVLSDIDSADQSDTEADGEQEVDSDDEEFQEAYSISIGRKRPRSESISTTRQSSSRKQRRWEKHAVELQDIMLRFKGSMARTKSTHADHSELLPPLEDEDDTLQDLALAHPLGSQIEHMKTQIDELEAKKRARRLIKMEQQKQEEIACG